MLPDPTPSGLRPAMTPALRPSMTKPFAQMGGMIAVIYLGPLQIDGFSVLVDTFPITFA